MACIYIHLKLDSFHALFRDGSHSGTDVCVVDWFSDTDVPWIPFAKFKINYQSCIEFVINQSLHYLSINCQHQIPIIIRLFVFTELGF